MGDRRRKSEVRNRRVEVRFTEKEYQMLYGHCTDNVRTISDYLRESALYIKNINIHKHKYTNKTKTSAGYSPEFISFWDKSNKKGSKSAAFTAFKNRLKTHTLADIDQALLCMQREKQNSELKFWPNISTFLNNDFEGYHTRRSHEQSIFG